DPAVRQVVDVVEGGYVGDAVDGEALQQPVAPARPTVGLPGADDVGHPKRRLLAVADHSGVDEVRDRLRVERSVTTGDDDRVPVAAVTREQRDAGEVERGEHVGVAELGGEGDAEDVEGSDRPVRV